MNLMKQRYNLRPAMIAFAAMLRLERGEATALTTEINPNLALA
jgi:hypothetical protein